MSLTSGRGPLSSRPAGLFVPPVALPVSYIEPFRRRVRGLLGGATVVDSDSVVLVHRADQPPSYGFPAADVTVADKVPLPAIPGYVTVPWEAVDTWLEEEEPVPMHPRNPYHRVDCLQSRRRLRVEAGGAVVVDTERTVAVYETALDPRLYVSRALVAPGLLAPSPTRTYCRYKGEASYWNLAVGDVVLADAAWSYENALSESAPITGCVSFDETKVSVTTDLPAPAAL